MGFRDPPQLSRDGWTREPKPSVKVQVTLARLCSLAHVSGRTTLALLLGT